MTMSGQYGQKKKQPRGGNPANYGSLRQRPPKNQEKSVLSDGIYKNELFMFNALSVIGGTVKIWVNNGRIYEGIFRTFNSGLDIVVDNVHVVEGSKLPCKENIIPHMVFHWKDIVNMNFQDVNMDFAILGGDGCIDASAGGRHNGRTGERELQPWIHAEDGSEIDPGSLDESNSNGWPANIMFETNESKFNYKSKYDPSLKDYTTELRRADTDEYRNREAEAERHAQEIQSSSSYSDNIDLENGDEEMLFSAVHRPEETGVPAAGPPTGNGGKYVVPQHRNAQQGATTAAQRPQQLVVLPSTQAEAVRSQHQMTGAPPPVGVETLPATAVISSSPGVIRINAGEARKEEIERPQVPPAAKGPVGTASFEHATEKPKASVANVSVKAESQKPRSEAIQELKDFRENFKLPDSASEPKEPKHQAPQPLPVSQNVVASVPAPALPLVLPQSMLPSHPQVVSQQVLVESNHRAFQEDKGDMKEEIKEDISKRSVLNPAAKEFIPALKAYGTPRNLPSQTPPRPPSTVGSPVSVFMPYMQPNTQVYHPTILAPPANVQQPRNAGVTNKRASVSVSARPDVNPPPQAMAGAPLITQPVMIPGVHGGLMMQPVLRMIHQHPQNVVIDPNQTMFVASPLTSHQAQHPGQALGPATHHVIAGGALPGAMHASHVASQQTSGAPTPTPVHPYGQPPQPGSSMPLPTTSGTPQPSAPIQLYPGAPGGSLAMSHPHQIHPVSLQQITNNPTSPIIYQGPGGMMQFSQFPHQAPALAYAAAPGVHQSGPGQTPVGPGHQQMGGPHQPPPSMGPSSHVVMHGPQMVMGPQGQGAYMGMPVPAAMSQAPGLAQHPVAAFQVYSMPGTGHSFTYTGNP